VARLNKNAKYETKEKKVYDAVDYTDGGLISDKIVELNSSKSTIKLRVVTYK
jgi:hypothetical protein